MEHSTSRYSSPQHYSYLKYVLTSPTVEAQQAYLLESNNRGDITTSLTRPPSGIVCKNGALSSANEFNNHPVL
jgi:hypothetical protein